ncbi:WbqC family protein [Ulvibacterium sp.]|uniref:WbqC family protein n=1 Tax=Ulvibacterium sp. TaxID=2665914 RepID=UPI00261EEEB3|nr:WbqC family protein [Ulvibacterium sp.]
MKVGMMQPYLFPYLGYFQLVNAVDVFIFADDVNFMKGGFVNRNKILFHQEERYVTVPCVQSQNRLIKEIPIFKEAKRYPKNILRTIQQTYAKAPFYRDVFPIIESIFNSDVDSISTLASYSVELVSKYLKINVNFKFSAASFNHTKGQEKSIRLINITKELGGDTYVNPIGGKKLYDKEFFENQGIKLVFLESEAITYPQFHENFIPNLSIIDVIMFNSKEDVNKLLNKYRLL